jgi:exonuclease VII large subunit
MSWRRLLSAYDVERQLERGYTITLDGEGGLVRSAEGLLPGAVLVTRFATGRARSEVRAVDVATETRSEPPSGTAEARREGEGHDGFG